MSSSFFTFSLPLLDLYLEHPRLKRSARAPFYHPADCTYCFFQERVFFSSGLLPPAMSSTCVYVFQLHPSVTHFSSFFSSFRCCPCVLPRKCSAEFAPNGRASSARVPALPSPERVRRGCLSFIFRSFHLFVVHFSFLLGFGRTRKSG